MGKKDATKALVESIEKAGNNWFNIMVKQLNNGDEISPTLLQPPEKIYVEELQGLGVAQSIKVTLPDYTNFHIVATRKKRNHEAISKEENDNPVAVNEVKLEEKEGSKSKVSKLA